MLIENQVIEMLEAGVAIEDIAKHLDITIDEVKDIEDYACENRDCGPTLEFASEEEYEEYRDSNYRPDEDDGQPDEYTEWQDYMNGDDWDHGQYDHAE